MNAKLKEAKEKFNAWVEKHFGEEVEEESTESTEEQPETEETPEQTEDKFETVLLVDGETEVTIEPAIEMGAAIVIATPEGPVAAPVGEYELQDGRVIVVEEDGVVAAVQDAVAEEEPMANDSPDNAEQVKRVIERIEKEKIFERLEELEKDNKFLKEENGVLKAELVENRTFQKETFEALLSEPSKDPVVKQQSSINKFREEFGGTDPLSAWLEKNSK